MVDGSVKRGFARQVTIKDVARLSGVSPATVTRVMQGRASVREETRRQVEQAVEALGYRPDHIARALVTRSSRTIGLLLPSSGDSFWGEVAAGIEERASEAEYSVIFANAHGSVARETDMIELFIGKRVDGIVIAGATGDPRSWLARREPEVPLVLVNWDAAFKTQDLRAATLLPPEEMVLAVTAEAGGRGFGHIAFDDLGAASAAVDHLVSLGHSDIAFVGGTPIRPALLRILGFRRALELAGLPPGSIVPCGETLEAGRDATRTVLAADDPPSAIIAYSDVVAIGAMRAAHALGVLVPEELSIVGVDDIDVAAFVEPPLTTIRQPKHRMGREAMEWILRQLAGGPVQLHDTLPGTLVVRSSTGPATQVDRG
jgi:DNA-binding LacI/PurR family transcriptional regulator